MGSKDSMNLKKAVRQTTESYGVESLKDETFFISQLSDSFEISSEIAAFMEMLYNYDLVNDFLARSMLPPEQKDEFFRMSSYLLKGKSTLNSDMIDIYLRAFLDGIQWFEQSDTTEKTVVDERPPIIRHVEQIKVLSNLSKEKRNDSQERLRRKTWIVVFAISLLGLFAIIIFVRLLSASFMQDTANNTVDIPQEQTTPSADSRNPNEVLPSSRDIGYSSEQYAYVLGFTDGHSQKVEGNKEVVWYSTEGKAVFRVFVEENVNDSDANALMHEFLENYKTGESFAEMSDGDGYTCTVVAGKDETIYRKCLLHNNELYILEFEHSNSQQMITEETQKRISDSFKIREDASLNHED